MSPDHRSNEFGSYFGRLLLEPLEDGRLMRLEEAFGFCDAKDKRWPVPAHAEVDGASIPRALWSVMGGPFAGKYRDASVVHDYYCSVRIEPWQAVHRVFYDAMRASGVSEPRAKLMYGAVYFAGPRWTGMDSRNTRLPRIDDQGNLFSESHSRFERDVFDVMERAGRSASDALQEGPVRGPESRQLVLDVGRLAQLIEDYAPTLNEIDRAVDLSERILLDVSPGAETEHELILTPDVAEAFRSDFGGIG